jgi:hypothetical protein
MCRSIGVLFVQCLGANGVASSLASIAQDWIWRDVRRGIGALIDNRIGVHGHYLEAVWMPVSSIGETSRLEC